MYVMYSTIIYILPDDVAASPGHAALLPGLSPLAFAAPALRYSSPNWLCFIPTFLQVNKLIMTHHYPLSIYRWSIDGVYKWKINNTCFQYHDHICISLTKLSFLNACPKSRTRGFIEIFALAGLQISPWHQHIVRAAAVGLFVLSHLVPACQGHALHEPRHATSPAIPEPAPCSDNDV